MVDFGWDVVGESGRCVVEGCVGVVGSEGVLEGREVYVFGCVEEEDGFGYCGVRIEVE